MGLSIFESEIQRLQTKRLCFSLVSATPAPDMKPAAIREVAQVTSLLRPTTYLPAKSSKHAEFGGGAVKIDLPPILRYLV